MSPEATIQLLAAHAGPVIIDFDETLYLRSSTEDFLDCARPALVAKVLLQGLNLLRPWRLTGGVVTRDSWRVVLISVLLPWVWWRWRRQVNALAALWTNQELRQALQSRPQIFVASAGFTAVIAPLLRAMQLAPPPPLIACRMLPFRDRLRGKQAVVTAALGETTIQQSMVITDSTDDADLLSACAQPCLTIWPRAHWRAALEQVYLPLTYLARVKRPGTRYIWRSIVQEDFAFWVLASLGAATVIGPHILGLAFMLLSFWSVYETGYVDNDRSGERHEHKPKLSAAYATHRVPTPVLTPWIWATISAYIGLAVLAGDLLPPLGGVLAWAAVLGSTWGCFRLFNRVDKRSRIWLFGLLQLSRIAAVAAVASISPIGAAALAAHLVALWMPYVFYRYGDGQVWKDLPVFTTRLFLFVVMSALLTVALGPLAIYWPTALALLGWNLFRARKELQQLARQARRIDRHIDRDNPVEGQRQYPTVASQTGRPPRTAKAGNVAGSGE